MKLIAQTLTKTEAALLCERISIIEQTRPRVKEILEVEEAFVTINSPIVWRLSFYREM